MSITFPELTEVSGKLDDRRKALADLMAEAKNDKGELDASKVKGFSSGSELAEHVRSINAEIDDLAKQREGLVEVAKAAKLAEESDSLDPELTSWLAGETGAPAVGGRKQAKSFGELFVESKAGTDLKGTEVELKDYELKTLFETGAGWAAETMRGPKLVDYATRPLRVIDLVPQTTTNQTAIVYMEETTFTNAAVEVAEGGTKPEGALALTERSDTVRKIAVWIPVTDEQLEDVPRIRQYLDNRLGFMVRQRLDSQILVGDGTAPNISGILDRSGLQTQAKGADPVPDAVYKAITKVRVNAFAEPNAAVFHPNDWQDVRLLRTADGVYIWGSPADPGPERIWGLRVVQTTGLTENTGLVGDFEQTELAVKKGVTVEVSNSHGTYFVENKQAVRAEMRAALAVYRPAAFCSVTGI
jgi:HK97 family phage major capsid protein